MRNKFLITLGILILSLTVSAGFEAYNQNTKLGIYTTFKCANGTNCAVTRNTLSITASPTVAGVLNPIVAATYTTLTAADCGNTYYNTGIVQIDLPEASIAIGCRLTFVVIAPSNFDINPENADKIEGLTNSVGDMIRSSVPGTSVVLQAVTASQWMVISNYGTWADAN